MKFTTKTVLLLLLLNTIFSTKVFSQSTIDPLLLHGTWIFNYEKSIKEMPPQDLVHFDELKKKATLLSRFEATYKGRKMSFLDGGVYILELTDGRKMNASWSLNNNCIELVSAIGTKLTYKIVVLTNNQLELQNTATANGSGPIFSRSHYMKI